MLYLPVLLLLCNVTKIPDAIVQIVQGAFGYGDGIQGIRAVAGGVLGAMMAAMQKRCCKRYILERGRSWFCSDCGSCGKN